MDVKKLYVHSTKNRSAIEISKKCGCFHCCNIFDAKKVKEYTEEMDGSETGICPLCSVDTLIPDSSVPTLTVEILNLMCDEYVS